MTALYVSIDLEDYTHATARFLGVPERRDPEAAWRGSETVRQALRDAGGEGRLTFFTTGQVARDQPDLIAELAAQGHEIGCHGDLHDDVTDMTRAEFRDDLGRARDAIESAANHRCLGFRAPNFSIDERTPWAHEVLAESGFLYDSSRVRESRITPGRLYDELALADGRRLLEFPVFRGRLGGRLPVRVIGGTYFRLLPTNAILGLLRQAAAAGFTPLLYLHCADVDPRFQAVRMADMAGFAPWRRLLWAARQSQWRLGTGNAAAKLAAVLRVFPHAGTMASACAPDAARDRR